MSVRYFLNWFHADIKIYIFKCTFLGVNWRDFNKTLDSNSLHNDSEFGKFINIVSGSSYNNLSQCIHSLNVDDIKSFKQDVVNTESEIFQKYKNV